MRKIRVMTVGSHHLSRVIGYLFHGGDEFEVVGSTAGLRGFAARAERVHPELIIIHVPPVRTGVSAALRSIKRSYPFAKLILICPVTGLMNNSRESGADSCVEQEALVARLVPVARALSIARAVGSEDSISRRNA